MHEYLPATVSRYFRSAIGVGPHLISSARIVQKGEFRLSGSGSSWRPFTATQQVSMRPPGFVWDARIRIAPLLAVHVRDAHKDGTASMKATLGGWLPIVNQRDTPELTAGALQRYLAEAVWYPTVLLPGHGIRWTSIDDATAEATLVDSETTASMQFEFNRTGEIVRAFSSNRFREVRGRYVATPWEVRLWDYQPRTGIRVPAEGEVAWVIDGVRRPYWRGRIVDIEYRFE